MEGKGNKIYILYGKIDKSVQKTRPVRVEFPPFTLLQLHPAVIMHNLALLHVQNLTSCNAAMCTVPNGFSMFLPNGTQTYQNHLSQVRTVS